MYTLTKRIVHYNDDELNPREIIYDDSTFCVILKFFSEEFNFQFTEETFLYDNIIHALYDISIGNLRYNFKVLLGLCDFLTEDQKNFYRFKYNLIEKIPDPKYKPIDLEDILYEADKLKRLRENWLG